LLLLIVAAMIQLCPFVKFEIVMKVELEDFYNDGFGWVCRKCERELAAIEGSDDVSRLISEGEAESKQPAMSTGALAKWLDPAQTTLVCPRCGISETVDAR
jgi:hypothetical protein